MGRMHKTLAIVMGGWLRWLALSGLFSTALCGCAGFWDEVTSREFHVKTMFERPDPMVVLRESTDGDKRARALRSLREPRENGGTEEDQNAIVKILLSAATTEKQPLCRLAAIETLGKFKDPRAAQGLSDAFYKAGSFVPDTATIVRCQALTALGKTKDPSAVELLARVVREPPAEGTEIERQHSLDVRMAAARALGQFQNQPQAAEALAKVARTERDVALRNCAHLALQKSTGTKITIEPPASNQPPGGGDKVNLAGHQDPASDANQVTKP